LGASCILGENLIGSGTDGTNSRRYVGLLPPVWVVEGGTSGDVINSLNVTVSEDLDTVTVNAMNKVVMEYNGHYYLLTDNAMTWSEAESYAQTLGGHLVTISDQQEQNWVSSRFGWATPWIGLTDEIEEGTWVWSSGEDITYTNWASGHPYSYYYYDYASIQTDGTWHSYNGTSETHRGLIELTGADTDGTGCLMYWILGLMMP